MRGGKPLIFYLGEYVDIGGGGIGIVLVEISCGLYCLPWYYCHMLWYVLFDLVSPTWINFCSRFLYVFIHFALKEKSTIELTVIDTSVALFLRYMERSFLSP